MTTLAYPYETTFQGYEANRDKLASWTRINYIATFKLKPGPMLDVACGNGFWGGIFADEGFDVSGFDSNANYIADGLDKWPGLKLTVGSVDETFPYLHRFPLVFCRTLPHFYAEDLDASIPVMRRLIDSAKKYLLLSFWTDESRERSDSGFWLWSQSDFHRIIEAAGGQVSKVVRSGGYLNIGVRPVKRSGVSYIKASGLMGTYPQAFTQDALAALDVFLASASKVVPMREASTDPSVIALRHDVDHSIEHALKLGEWEAKRGYRSSYYVLHTAPYFNDKGALYSACRELEEMGHEVGLHNNSVIQAKKEGRLVGMDGAAHPAGTCARPAEIITEALTELRGQGLTISGTAAHGDANGREWGLHNNDVWAAGYSPQDFGMEYEAYHLHRASHYITDNGGKLSKPLALHETKQTHLLTHPEHWPVNEQ